jgi:hypothetical protein
MTEDVRAERSVIEVQVMEDLDRGISWSRLHNLPCLQVTPSSSIGGVYACSELRDTPVAPFLRSLSFLFVLYSGLFVTALMRKQWAGSHARYDKHANGNEPHKGIVNATHENTRPCGSPYFTSIADRFSNPERFGGENSKTDVI